MIRLGPTTGTDDLVDQLNTAGLTTGHGRPFDVDAVQWIRHAHHIPAPNPYADGEISVAEAAHRLGISTGAVYDWIKTGKLAARRGPGNRLLHPLDRPHRSRMPSPHRRIRPPQPRSPPHQTPQPGLKAPDVGAGWHHHSATKPTSTTITDRTIPTRDCRRGSMKHPSRPWPTGWCRRP